MTQGCARRRGGQLVQQGPTPVGCCFGSRYVFPTTLPQNGSLVAGGCEHPAPGLGGHWDLGEYWDLGGGLSIQFLGWRDIGTYN